MQANTRKRKWSAKVKTESTYPPAGTFTKQADEIARILSRKEVSPKGLGSAIKMVQLFINRAGKNFEPSRKESLKKRRPFCSANKF
jgi:hypothetical protein